MTKTLQREDLLRFSFLSSLETSPEGEALLYRKTVMERDKNRYRSHWRLLRLEEQQDIKLTSEAIGGPARWLDKTSLIFMADREEEGGSQEPQLAKTRLYRISTQGGEAELWQELPYAVSDFHILPDGRLLLSVSDSPEQRALREAQEIKDSKEQAEAQRRIKEERDYQVIDEVPFWFNGGSYTVGERQQLYLYDLEKKQGSLLSDKDMDASFLDMEVKDGHCRILYDQQPHEELMRNFNASVHIWDSRTNESRRLNPEGQNLSYHMGAFCGATVVLAAADGTRYGLNEDPYFYHYTEQDGFVATGRDAFCGGSTGTDICYGGGRFFQGVDEADPRGAGLYFIQQRGRNAQLCFYSLKTGDVWPLHETEGAVNAFALGQNQLYFIGLRELKGQELYRLDAEGQEHCLSTHNSWLEEFSLSKPQSLYFRSSDGQEQEGFVILPPEGTELEPGQVPGLLTVHGGPKTAYGSVLMHEMQMLAAQGFAVFYTNPHGSDGYGRTWADIRGHYGELDYEDLMRFTDLVLEKFPQIDGERLGVLGGSYGGFMTNWIIGHTERFKAAATQRSISNWFSMYGISDIGYYFTQDQTAANPWDNPEKLWAQSPLRYARSMKTPTLIIHSDADYRCPIAEGYQLLTALKVAGVPSRMVCFKGENHELSRGGKPLHRLRRLEEIQNWMRRYLQD